MNQHFTLNEPQIQYLSSTPNGDIVPDQRQLDCPLPLHLSDLGPPPQDTGRRGLTYGRYFEIVRGFLARDSYRPFLDAVRQSAGKTVTLQDIQRIAIRTEKHGAVYHIASVDVFTLCDTVRLVVTLALSDVGKLCLEKDYHWLDYLNRRLDSPYVPRGYGNNSFEYRTPQGTLDTLLISLGEWFTGYHEFHLSVDPADQRQKTILWDTDHVYGYLSYKQSCALYHQASKILTLCYDTDTYHQVCAWHHAAGDFVARTDGDSVNLKLITVRQYGPMIAFSDPEPGNRLTALLHFFSHLCLRMRMDRLDGTGQPAWADDFSVYATMEGFYEALETKRQQGALSGIQVEQFLALLKMLDRNEWSQLLQATLETCPQTDADLPVIARHLDSHIDSLYKAVQRFEPVRSDGRRDQ